jgi:uncharacterized membrane protein
MVTKVVRLGLAALFLASGVAHLVRPGLYRPIMPPALPSPEMLILISGVAEIAGGAGLLSARFRPAAGAGLVVVLIAVFPANVEMLRQHRRRCGAGWFEALLWLRLPLQAVLIWTTWRISRSRRLPPAS